jgi:hypothetical protein
MGGSLAVRAQQASAPPDVLSALLVEVRGLRAAMEQAAFAGSTVQILLGRVQLQEQRISNQIRRLDAVRASLLPAQKDLDPMEREVREFEEAVRRVHGAAAGDSQAEQMLRERKGEIARRRAEVRRLMAEEALLAQDVASEQARWMELNQRLEEFERTLARR